MSHNQKPGRVHPPQPNLFGVPPDDVQPKDRERIAQLIASNKSGHALDIAKELHKRCKSASSEALLLDTYGARLASLAERKLDREAAILMDLVRDRFPSAQERLKEWAAAFAARRGDLSALLQPLNDPSLPAEKHAAISAAVRRDAFELRALAECGALPAEHPLRTAAAALQIAFEAVTTGPVADEALALPQVSRSSPLAPWKMLARAIAAYYRRDDELCQKCLAAIEPDSAAARLAPALRAMTSTTPPTLTPAGAALVSQAGDALDSLRATLKRLDSALDRRNQPLVVQEIRAAVPACRQTVPAVLERLKQHISIRSLKAGLAADRVAAAMDGPCLKNAYFWRLLARSLEEQSGNSSEIGLACSAWEEFRKHALREGWLPAQGPEAAALYIHMADLLHRLDAQELGYVRKSLQLFNVHASYYQGQPPEIRALMPDRKDQTMYFLAPHAVLQRACDADPCKANFERWMRYAESDRPAMCDLVAERWSAALPQDISPLLRLMQAAEKKNALQKAFKLMDRAEKLDGLNIEVRRSRLRLLVSIAVRHLREEKLKLAEQDLRQIEALPHARQGDRPAFTAALRFVLCQLRNEKKEAAAAYAEAVRFLGDAPTAQFLFLEVEKLCECGFSSLGAPAPPTKPLWEAFGRVCALGEDMDMPVELEVEMPEIMMNELSAPNLPRNPRALQALGEAAMDDEHAPLAYAIAGAGLTQGAETQARFLFLRARALPPWEEGRTSQCLAAASELARRQHDSDLLRRIGQWREEEAEWLDTPEKAQAALDTAEIAHLVQREIDAKVFPDSPSNLPNGKQCQCPACCAERGELPELMDLANKLGPEELTRALGEILGIGGRKKKRGRRSPTFDGMDFPF